MDINFICTRKRRTFGKPCAFSDVGPNLTLEIDPNPAQRENYHMIPTVDREIDNSTRMCVHEVNTVSYPSESRGMNHLEGGWPASVDCQEEDSTARFRKKVEKDKSYVNCVKSLADFLETFIMENNSIDIYEEYFDGERIDSTKDFSVRNMSIFQDVSGDYRSVVDLSWTRDSSKFAAAYTLKQANEYPLNLCADSYVWDAENSISPVCILKPEVFMCCVECSPTNENLIISGYVSGQVALWDIRVSGRAQQLSSALASHTQKVSGLKWLVSKDEMAFISTSYDGQLISWDARNLSNPTAAVQLETDSPIIPNIDQNYTISCVEYDLTVPNQFMVGTEQGVVLCFNRKYTEKKGMLSAKYDCLGGPLLAVERNSFFPQLFATCDTMSIKIWSDSVEDSPILNITSCDGFFTDIAWSPTRASTVYATKTTGVLEVWDIPGKNKDALLKVKFADEAFLAVAVSEAGDRVACGTLSGSIQLLNIPEYLRGCSDLETQLVKDCVRECETVIGGKRRSERILDEEEEPAAVEKDEDFSDPPEKAEDLYEENKTLLKGFTSTAEELEFPITDESPTTVEGDETDKTSTDQVELEEGEEAESSKGEGDEGNEGEGEEGEINEDEGEEDESGKGVISEDQGEEDESGKGVISEDQGEEDQTPKDEGEEDQNPKDEGEEDQNPKDEGEEDQNPKDEGEEDQNPKDEGEEVQNPKDEGEEDQGSNVEEEG